MFRLQISTGFLGLLDFLLEAFCFLPKQLYSHALAAKPLLLWPVSLQPQLLQHTFKQFQITSFPIYFLKLISCTNRQFTLNFDISFGNFCRFLMILFQYFPQHTIGTTWLLHTLTNIRLSFKSLRSTSRAFIVDCTGTVDPTGSNCVYTFQLIIILSNFYEFIKKFLSLFYNYLVIESFEIFFIKVRLMR